MSETDFKYPDHIRDAAIEWRLLIETGEINADERAEFEAWRGSDPRHADAYDRATTVWAALGTLGRDRIGAHHFRPSLAEKFREIFVDLSVVFLRRRGQLAGLAAMTAVLVVGGAVLPRLWQASDQTMAEAPLMTAFSTGSGETKTVTLSDGSAVTLGAGTQIEVAMSSASRRVELTGGAAVFDVASDADRPFSVTAETFTARVLGTVFDVRNNGGVVRLSVSEGVVEANHPLMLSGQPSSVTTTRKLVAGQQVYATREDGLSRVGEFRAETFAAWRKDRLKYEGATLNELVADANRYSARPIRLDEGLNDLADVRVTVSFNGRDSDGMLTTLTEIFPVIITDDDDGNIILAKRPD